MTRPSAWVSPTVYVVASRFRKGTVERLVFSSAAKGPFWVERWERSDWIRDESLDFGDLLPPPDSIDDPPASDSLGRLERLEVAVSDVKPVERWSEVWLSLPSDAAGRDGSDSMPLS